MKEEKSLIGKVINLTDDSVKIIETLQQDEKNVRIALLLVIEMEKELHRRVWNFMKEAYPETEKYYCELDFKNHTINILGKK